MFKKKQKFTPISNNYIPPFSHLCMKLPGNNKTLSAQVKVLSRVTGEGESLLCPPRHQLAFEASITDSVARLLNVVVSIRGIELDNRQDSFPFSAVRWIKPIPSAVQKKERL